MSTPSFTPTPTGLLQRKCACGGTPGPDGECAECRKKRLQRRSTGQAEPSTVPPIVDDVLRSPGQPLDANTRDFMEPRFGHDFSRVRVHTDAQAAESAQAVNALAYTVGRDVVFGTGQYAPETSEGRRLLAHELTHVMQQRAANSSDGVLRVGTADDSSEREADLSAARAMTGAAAGLPGVGPLQVQRQELLAHEPTDVVQQGHVANSPSAGGLDPDCVREADQQRTQCILGASALEPGPYRDYRVNKCNQEHSTDILACPTDAFKKLADRPILGTYTIDKQGKIQGFNIDRITKEIVQALSESPNAYIRITGLYARESNLFNKEAITRERCDTLRRALIQWIGPTRFPNLEKRFDDIYIGETSLATGDTGQVEVSVAFSSARAAGLPPSSAPWAKEWPTSPKTQPQEKKEPPTDESKPELKYGATRERKEEEPHKKKEEEPHTIVKSEVEIPASLLGGSDRLSVTVSVGPRPGDASLGLEIKLKEGDWAKFQSPVGTTKLTFSSQVMAEIEAMHGKAESGAEAGVKVSQQVFKLPVKVYVGVANKVVIDTEGSAKVGPEASVGATITFDLSPPKRREKD